MEYLPELSRVCLSGFLASDLNMFNIQIVSRKSSFRISQIPNLEQWLDASQLTGLSNNDVMTLWPDLSNNGRNITSFTGSPQYKTSILNGLPAVTLEAGQGMAGSYSVAAGSFTTVSVFKLTSLANDVRRGLNGSVNWFVGPWQNTWKGYNAGFLDSGYPLDTNGIVTVFTQNALGGAFYAKNTTFTASNAGTQYPTTINFGVVGAFGEAMLGNICESAIFSRVLTSAEIEAVFTGLNQKWGIV